MKKNHVYLAIAASVILMVCSCRQEETPVVPTDEDDTEGGVEETACDELQMFQNFIVRTDNEGNFVERVYGKVLDEADTTVVSIGADNVEEARKIFERWLAFEPNVQETAPNVLTFYPKDEDGQAQGEIYFTPVSDDPTCTARVTFSAETPLRHFKQIDFIPNSLWPENNEGGFKKWDIWAGFTHVYTCVREKKNGAPTLFACISRYGKDEQNTPEHYYDYWDHYGKPCASPELAKEVADVAMEDWDAFVEHCIPEEIYGEEVYVSKKKDKIYDHGVYVMQLKKGTLKYYSMWDPRYVLSHHNYLACATWSSSY